jgi:hypothetical protein
MGGLMALAAASRDWTLRSIVLNSPWDLGQEAAGWKRSAKLHAEEWKFSTLVRWVERLGHK